MDAKKLARSVGKDLKQKAVRFALKPAPAKVTVALTDGGYRKASLHGKTVVNLVDVRVGKSGQFVFSATTRRMPVISGKTIKWLEFTEKEAEKNIEGFYNWWVNTKAEFTYQSDERVQAELEQERLEHARYDEIERERREQQASMNGWGDFA